MRRAALAAVWLGLAGCGAAEEGDRGASDPARPLAEAAQRTMASGGARLNGHMTMRTTGGEPRPVRAVGAISFDKRRSELLYAFDTRRMSDAELAAARREFSLPVREIRDGDVRYQSWPGRSVGDGKEWSMVDWTRVDEELDLDASGLVQAGWSNPEGMLRVLRAVEAARETATETIDGTETTRYSGTVDVRRYPDLVRPSERAAARRTASLVEQQLGRPTYPVDVWVDDGGVVRRERVTFHDGPVTSTLVLDFEDVGRPRDVQLPPPGNVLDMTEDVIAGLSERMP